MLADFFVVREQDSVPTEGRMRTTRSTGDTSGKFTAEKDASEQEMDFNSTFIAVSHKQASADQPARKSGGGNSANGSNAKAAETVLANLNGTSAQKRSAHRLMKSAGLVVKSHNAPAVKGNGKSDPSSLRMAHLREADSISSQNMRSSSKTGVWISSLKTNGKAETSGLNATEQISRAGAKKSGINLIMGASGEKGKVASQGAVERANQPVKKVGKGNSNASNVTEQPSIRPTQEKSVGAKGLKEFADLTRFFAQGKETQAQKGVDELKTAQLSPMNSGAASAKTASSEVFKWNNGSNDRPELSASAKELHVKRGQGEKQKSAGRGIQLNSNQADASSREAETNRQVKDRDVFHLGRKTQEENMSGKARMEGQSGESARVEKEPMGFANRVLGKGAVQPHEQGFERTILKPDTGPTDNSSLTPGHTSTTGKAPGNITPFATMGTVNQAFKENGLTQFVEKAAVSLKNGKQEFKLDLKPELLGQVRVQVSTENNHVTIRVLTELPLAKEVIENNLQHLRAQLMGHGLEIEKFEVALSQGSDKGGVEHGSSGSKRMKKGFSQKKSANAGSRTPEIENEGTTRRHGMGNGTINLFA